MKPVRPKHSKTQNQMPMSGIHLSTIAIDEITTRDRPIPPQIRKNEAYLFEIPILIWLSM